MRVGLKKLLYTNVSPITGKEISHNIPLSRYNRFNDISQINTEDLKKSKQSMTSSSHMQVLQFIMISFAYYYVYRIWSQAYAEPKYYSCYTWPNDGNGFSF